MKTEIKYIELKSGHNNNGPAWIGLVSFSKTRKTIYFNGRELQSLKGSGINANYFDIDSGEEYWISSVKKDLTDRHWAGNGIIRVEKRILTDYLKIIHKKELPKTEYEMVDLEKTSSR